MKSGTRFWCFRSSIVMKLSLYGVSHAQSAFWNTNGGGVFDALVSRSWQELSQLVAQPHRRDLSYVGQLLQPPNNSWTN